MKTKELLLLLTLAVFQYACSNTIKDESYTGDFYSIEVYSSKLRELLNPAEKVNILASGFDWSEGPVWVDDEYHSYVLFSDVPQNKIYKWSETEGLSTFMSPSGFDGEDASMFREAGTNGLIVFDEAHILAADHGRRGLSLIDNETLHKESIVTIIEGMSLNSPNDLVKSENSDIYFTDPPYGLVDLNDSPYKELGFNGVYLMHADGSLSVVDDSLSFPNGVGLSPDGTTLLVANSDPEFPIWKKYVLDEQGMPISSEIFYDASEQLASGTEGLPDGLAIDVKGNVFASGPGGLYIFSPLGVLLGQIKFDRAISNCTFGGEDGSTLFITADDLLVSIETRTSGIQL